MIEIAQTLLGPILAGVGAFVLTGGGLAAITYAIFKTFSERWLNTKFEERLAAYKHAQQTELEHLRLEINSLLDRNVKLHQKEFEILPQAWSLFNDAFWLIKDIWGFKTYPDLNTFSEAHLEEFLKGRRHLTDTQRDEIRNASDKTTQYIRFAEWDEIKEAMKSYSEWKKFYLKSGIFIPISIKTSFNELDELIKGALVEHKMRVEDRNTRRSEMKDFERLLVEGQKLHAQLEKAVQERLWSSAQPSQTL